MLSYNILHYNRPFFLELNIKMLRRFCPSVQIIVADDGSDKSVLKCVKKMSPDDLFVAKHIPLDKHNGSCSDAIEGALKLSKFPYYLFSEDDFLYTAKFIEDNVPVPRFSRGKLAPELYFNDLIGDAPLCRCISELDDPRIKLVQMARATPTLRKPIKKGGPWSYISMAKKDVYNNFPFLMRLEDRKKVSLPPHSAIYKVQRDMEIAVRSQFSEYTAARSSTACYIHVGSPLTLNILSKERIRNFRLAWHGWTEVAEKHQGSKKTETYQYDLGKDRSIAKFNDHILQLYLQGKFYVDFDQMLERGMNEAFTDAVKKIRDSLL
jgi:glycosyltransferase involved in cell wall biosynthesis